MRRQVSIGALGAALLGLVGYAVSGGGSAQTAGSGSSTDLGVADYLPDGRLAFPDDADRWIVLGSTLGGDYNDSAFDPENPGNIGVVQMEPAAYDYFVENRRYADGTMLLLTFYGVQQKPEPALQGFVQGDVVGREIHVIDRQRFRAEDRAFFLFAPSGSEPAAAMPLGSECVACHSAEAEFDSTFTQFYPAIRDLVPGQAVPAP